MRYLALLLLPLCLAACQDETVSGYAGAVWTLTEMEGAEAPAGVTLDLTEQGRISGQAPCNLYSATQSVPYPWIEIGPIVATERACPELAAEDRYLTLLPQMTLAEVQGDVLILSNTDGQMLVFTRQAAAP